MDIQGTARPPVTGDDGKYVNITLTVTGGIFVHMRGVVTRSIARLNDGALISLGMSGLRRSDEHTL